jgi:SAM-dependent methyltransferase
MQECRMRNDDTIFRGTASYYEQYRPRYPHQLLTDLVGMTVGERGRHCADLGCGTGEVALPLSRHFDDVVAVDIDSEMIALAQQRADADGVGNVVWTVGPAEELDLPPERFDLVTAGSSFHWMDRATLAGRIHAALVEGGSLALLGGGSDVWDGIGWHTVAADTITEWLGGRRAGASTYQVTGHHEDFLLPAGFRTESLRYQQDRVWTADEIVGYLYSTSFAGPALLGDRKEAFERDLRARLSALSPDEAFPERLEFYMMIARK